jgi:hypothetical protein
VLFAIRNPPTFKKWPNQSEIKMTNTQLSVFSMPSVVESSKNDVARIPLNFI